MRGATSAACSANSTNNSNCASALTVLDRGRLMGHYHSSDGKRLSDSRMNDTSWVVLATKIFRPPFCVVVCILGLMHLVRTPKYSCIFSIVGCRSHPDPWEIRLEKGELPLCR